LPRAIDALILTHRVDQPGDVMSTASAIGIAVGAAIGVAAGWEIGIACGIAVAAATYAANR